MFFFGDDPDLIASLYVDQMNTFGPKTPDIPFEEMDAEQIKNTYVRARMAYKEASLDGAAESVLEKLSLRIEETFYLACLASEEVIKSVEDSKFRSIGFDYEEYLEIVQRVRHPSSADRG